MGVDKPFRNETGTWTAFSFAANWGNEAGVQAGRYKRVGDEVRLEVMAARSTSTSGVPSTVGTLPTGYRPPATIHFPSIINAAGTFTPQRVTVNTDGTVVVFSAVTVGSAVPIVLRFHTS
jgi:hypothetical protein